MSVIEKIEWIYEECREDLNDWQREFITDLYDHAQNEEELTRRQIEKVNEIWEEMGL